jgi:ABC-type lipoprotein export system ATPase subunit
MLGQPAVFLRGVKKSFQLADGTSLEVLDVQELSLPAGSCTVLRGRSGSGKTTLLNLIAGVSVPTAGIIHVDDTDIVALPEARRDRFRAEHVGYVFQTFNLLSAFSALENVMLSMTFAEAVHRREQRLRATELLTRLGLAARLSQKPQHLSRGEQQRVAIARALANDPPLILADEPCASLDATTAREVLAAFLTACRNAKKTLLAVSHDDAVAGAADRVLDISEINRVAEGNGPRSS